MRELAEYERAPDAAVATESQLHDVLFGPQAAVFCDVAEVDGEVVGMAVWFLSFSTWLGRHGIYLEDLYVRPSHRRGPREGAAGHAGPALRRAGLRTAGVVGARLEHAGHRLLRRPGRSRHGRAGRSTAWPATPLAALATEAPPPCQPVASFGMERFGLVGLPNAGKSSLYNALTGGGALAAPYAFATKDPNIGVAKVPDAPARRAGGDVEESKNVVHAAVQVVDIGGLVEGASKGEGLGNRFLASIREVDAIVLRPAGVRGRRRARADRPARAPAGRGARAGAGRPARRSRASCDRRQQGGQGSTVAWPTRSPRSKRATPRWPRAARSTAPASTPSSRALLRPYFLLTNKPVLAVVNVGEDELDRPPTAVEAAVAGRAAGGDGSRCSGCASSSRPRRPQLDGDERAEMLEALGLGEGALPRLVRSAYHLLGLRTFLTTGDKESRAWTFRAGAKAPECAGVIHTDLQRGFIRAEVIHWDELLEIGSWSKAKEVGKLRVEGKDYEVVDGDVMEIRFNV